jgi:hypothetical protein
MDGKRMGTSNSLNSASSYDFVNFTIGAVDLVEYKPHQIRIEAIIPGVFGWDYVQFNPESL